MLKQIMPQIMWKTLRKAIMRRSSLEAKYLKTRSNDSFKACKNHTYFSNTLHKKEK